MGQPLLFEQPRGYSQKRKETNARATRILLKWLNRKSQRKAYNWARFNQALAWVGWPRMRIRTDLNPCRRAEAYWMAGRGGGCWESRLSGSVGGWVTTRVHGRDLVAPPRERPARPGILWREIPRTVSYPISDG